MKELAIGEIGEIDGVKVKCVAMPAKECCEACAFNEKHCIHITCTPSGRADEEWVSYQAVKS